MHWVVQNNLFPDAVVAPLVDILERHSIAHSAVAVLRSGGGIEPDVRPANPVVIIGSFALARHALGRGWSPGSWLGRDAAAFSFQACSDALGDHMLNGQARVVRFAEALAHSMERFFVRPIDDGKSFAGTVVTRAACAEWLGSVVAAPGTSSPLTPDTLVVVAPVRDIVSETRFVVVDGTVVTGSLYRRGGRVVYDGAVDPEVADFARSVAATWTPDRVCVMDVARTPDGMKVVEFNNFNSARWYAADVSRIVQAIEGLDG